MSLLRGRLLGQRPRTEWRVVFNCFQVKWILSQFHKFNWNKKKESIYFCCSASGWVGMCQIWEVWINLLSFPTFFDMMEMEKGWVPSSSSFLLLPLPLIALVAVKKHHPTTRLCYMTVLLCAVKAVVEWRFVCIGAALGNSLFTLCVFVVDSHPTHVSTLCVSAGSLGSALSHSA